jgi:hypothetical protein
MDKIKTCTRCNTPIDGSPASVTRCVLCEETVASAYDPATLAALAAIEADAQRAADAIEHTFRCEMCFYHGAGFCPTTDNHEADEAYDAELEAARVAEIAAFVGPRLPDFNLPYWDNQEIPF